MSTLEKFAEELKARRKAQGLSIDDIYEITRIDKNYLQEMEKGDFEIMPDVYMRAFIRKYADAVELDPEEVIKKYEAAKSGKAFDEKAMHDSKKKSEESIEVDDEGNYSNIETGQGEASGKNYNIFLIIGFVIIAVLIGVFYFVFIHSDNEEIIVEQRVEDILNERSKESESSRFEVKKNILELKETSPKVGAKASKIEKDSLSLQINALDTVWFRTQIDNTKKDEFILNPNRSKTLNAKSKIDLLIGNTGGIEFVLNGKKIDFLGKKGEIRNITFDADGIHYSKMKTTSEK